MTTQPSEGFEPLVYLAVLYRWKWLVIAATLLCVVLGYAYLGTRTPLYAATAQLLYSQPVTVANPLMGGAVIQALQQPDVSTVSAVVSGEQVSEAAAELLEGENVSADYYVAARGPVDINGNIVGSAHARVVAVDAVSSSPQTAAAAANAYAEAFVTYRRGAAQTQLSSVLANVESALASFTTPSARRGYGYLRLVMAEQALQLQLRILSSDYTLATPATKPSVSFLPRKRRTLTYFAMLGLALGMGMAFLFEQFDTRVRDEREIADLLGLAVLGRLPPLRRRTDDAARVRTLDDPLGPTAEGVRVLRGNIAFASVDGDVNTLLISSSVRGEGTSVVACDLAVSMALAGQRVVLVDADLRHPSVHVHMQVSNAVGLSSVLARRADLWAAVSSFPLHNRAEAAGGAAPATPQPEGTANQAGTELGSDAVSRRLPCSPDTNETPALRVLPSGPLPPNPGEMAASERFGEVIRLLANTADLVIIGSPPLLEVGDAAAMAPTADGLVIVVNMARVRRQRLERCRAVLDRLPCRVLGVAVIATRRARRQPVYRYLQSSAPGSTSAGQRRA